MARKSGDGPSDAPTETPLPEVAERELPAIDSFRSPDFVKTLPVRMYTRCPGCGTVYRVTVAQLREGSGEALCLECRDTFCVLKTLSETPSCPSADESANSGPVQLGRLDSVVFPGISGHSLSPAERLQEGGFGFGTKQEGEGRFAGWLKNAESRNKASPGWRLAWGGGVLLSFALLVAQVVHFGGSRLAQDERFRPSLAYACRALGCTLIPFHAPKRIRVLHHELRPAPNGIDGYEFILVLSNQASLPQAFPAIKLILSGFHGSPVAARKFLPADYLEDSGSGLMESDKPHEIRLLLAAPRHEFDGFSFELL